MIAYKPLHSCKPQVCGRCGKPLSNPKSTLSGLGFHCKERIEFELSVRTIKARCMHDFYCLPEIENIAILLEKAKEQFESYGIEWNEEARNVIIESLGLNRPRVELTKQEQKRMQDIVRRAKDKELAIAGFFRFLKQCPYGLDCKDPNRAFETVYYLIACVIQASEKDYKVAEKFLNIIDPLLGILDIFGASERKHYEEFSISIKRKGEELRRKEERQKIAKELEELLKILE